MSAIVTIPSLTSTRNVHVPRADDYSIDSEGRLRLTASYSDVAVFNQWSHVVIERERDSSGRFVKRGS